MFLVRNFEGMSPEWQKEHDEAFAIAQNEAKGSSTDAPNAKCGYVKMTGTSRKAFVLMMRQG